MTIEVVRDNDRFGLLQGSIPIDLEVMIDLHLLIIELPASADERIAVGDEVVLRGYQDEGWQFEFLPGSRKRFHIPPRDLTGMKFAIL